MPMVAPLIDCFPARENLQHKLPASSARLAVRMTVMGGFALGILPLIPPVRPHATRRQAGTHVGVSCVSARHCWGIARHH